MSSWSHPPNRPSQFKTFFICSIYVLSVSLSSPSSLSFSVLLYTYVICIHICVMPVCQNPKPCGASVVEMNMAAATTTTLAIPLLTLLNHHQQNVNKLRWILAESSQVAFRCSFSFAHKCTADSFPHFLRRSLCFDLSPF